MNRILTILVLLLIMTLVHANDGEISLTTESLLANGFKLMTAMEIHDRLKGRTLSINDLEANSRYELVFMPVGSRELKKVIEDDLKTLTRPEFQARAQLLTGLVYY